MAEAREEEDRSQLIAHFQEITGIEDHDQSVEILSLHEWNLEASIQDTLNEKEGIRPIFHTPPAPEIETTPPAPATLRRRVVQPPITQYTMRAQHRNQAVARQQGWWDWLVNLALLPLRFTVTTASDLFHFLMNLLFGFRPALPVNPGEDIQQFVTEFEEAYGTQHPRFLDCGYDEALSKAREELQFLLVYIHSPSHRDTPQFCREVMCSQEFIDFVSERMLMWGVSVNSQEGARVSYILRESTYPFLALVVLKQSRLIVCERVEGTVPLQTLIETLQAAITNNEPELVVERNERFRRVADQQLREDQDAAYQESLAADREKERKKQEALEREEAQARQVREKQEEEERQKQEFEVNRAIRISRLPPQPDNSDPSAITVLLRLPSGHRLERRFTQTDKLESVYDFAYTDDSGQLPHKFTLVTNFPRKELQPDGDGGPQLLSLGLGKRCALYVHDDMED